ncbi:hypothetical protein MCHIJ_50910 [Mycolicibacterium chitae]|nr:hypothetical protein MCHIJ_50910 [Mycolicibacterium chitae]
MNGPEDIDDDVATGVDIGTDQPHSPVRAALVVGLVALTAVGSVAAWLGHQAYESLRVQHEHHVFLQAGRQTALNLTSIDHTTAEQDVARILESATGAFRDDFQSRTDSFVEVVRKAQSKSEGTIVESGVESATGNEAQVLVAVNVLTTNAGAPEQEPRSWRMRMTVQKSAGDAKVSDVEFVA